MNIWQFGLVLSLFLLFVFGHNNTGWRTIYITSDSGKSCFVDHCPSLQDVISNWSYFIGSNTTLELLPGRYVITENVGHLVIANVKNFRLKGTSLFEGSVTISCQNGATLGFTFVHSQNIEIVNIQINHCSAKLEINASLLNTMLTFYDYGRLDEYLGQNFRSCDVQVLCHIFLACFGNTEMRIYRTTILHSTGIGVFSYNNNKLKSDLDISESILAHNQINCVHFVVEAANSIFSLSDSRIMSGQTNISNLSSGLNLIVHFPTKEHNVTLSNVTFMNNFAHYGNFYMHVLCRESKRINIHILITNLSSIQTEEYMSGIVVKYQVYLEKAKNRLRDLDACIFPHSLSHELSFGYHNSDYDDLFRKLQGKAYTKSVNIAIQDSSFIGSCVNILDSEIINEDGTFSLQVNNITISESRCLMAATFIGIDDDTIGMSDVTIINSHNNILYVHNVQGTLQFSGNTRISSNQGSVSVVNGRINFRDVVQFTGNIAQNYESTFQITDSSNVSFEGEAIFTNNTGRQGGAISLSGLSHLTFVGSNVSFIGNSAENGGAISLKQSSVIILRKDTHTVFRGNIANTYGGAMYVEDESFWIQKKKFRIKCFIQKYLGNEHYELEFEKNIAGKAGETLFGGWLDLCEPNYIMHGIDFLDSNAENGTSVSSNPTRVCKCENSTLLKHVNEIHIEVFPGQNVQMKVVAVGQQFGIVPATIRAETGVGIIDELQKTQDTGKNCTELKFTFWSSNRNETMLLLIDKNDLPQNCSIADELIQLRVSIFFNDCPLGFVFEMKQNACVCNNDLVDHGVQCDFTYYTVKRSAQQWIGASSTERIIVHQHCPYDYCKSDALSLNLSNPDDQCNFNRSGILCGACQPGLSQVFGTSKCKECSSYWLLLTIVFALIGILLVAGLMTINLTVTVGTINGLIFYANIIWANNAVYFPGKMSNTFLSTFIAWLNLDLGIEMCFFDGLDAYGKTWLQFSFPFYIWLLVLVIILSSKYSIRVTRLCRKNAVQVLATLFILSYAKLLRLTITVLQPTHLLGGHKVWHYDGNVVYLGKRHILLMTVALIFFAFFIPYTLIIFGIQWLQPFSHYKLFVWVNKFKPLLDAYTGPYKDKHRYWTGLLLLVRIGLFTVFSANTTGDPAINLLAIIVINVCLFSYLALFAGIYKVWFHNVLEYSFLLNLILLSAGVLYSTSAGRPVYIITLVSVSITLSVTIFIVAYHSLTVILKALRSDINLKFSSIKFWFRKSQNKDTNNLNMKQDAAALTQDNKITHSVVELTQPLIY